MTGALQTGATVLVEAVKRWRRRASGVDEMTGMSYPAREGTTRNARYSRSVRISSGALLADLIDRRGDQERTGIEFGKVKSYIRDSPAGDWSTAPSVCDNLAGHENARTERKVDGQPHRFVIDRFH